MNVSSISPTYSSIANAYFDDGKYHEAIYMYKQCISAAQSKETEWECYYKMGIAYKKVQMIENAITSWIDAYESAPEKNENLCEIIEYYTNERKYKLAHAFYNFVKQHTYATEYKYLLFAYYLGLRNVNNQIVIIMNECKEEWQVKNALVNLRFYDTILQSNAITHDISFSEEHMIDGISRQFYSSSASILFDEETYTYILNIRMVNYSIDKQLGCYFFGKQPNNTVITINKYMQLSKDCTIIEEAVLYPTDMTKQYIGNEDLRLARYGTKENEGQNDRLLYMGTQMRSDGTLGISYGIYDKTQPFGMDTTSHELTPRFGKQFCEKNWVFVPVEGETYIIYNWFPIKLCTLHTEDNTIDIHRTIENVPGIFKYMRGSSNGVQYKDELWFITHIVSYEKLRHYYHVFVVFDKHMNLLRYSAPYKFDGERIEFTLGLLVEDDRVIIPYSTWDNTTKLKIIDKSYIDALIRYVP